MKRAAIAFLFGVLLAARPSVNLAQEGPEEPPPKPREKTVFLDAFDTGAAASAGNLLLSTGVVLGDAWKSGTYVNGGGRISYARLRVDGGEQSGFAIGAMMAIGYRIEGPWSPVGTLAVDRLFEFEDSYLTRVTASAGVRLRLGEGRFRAQAFRFEMFYCNLFGVGDRPDKRQVGLGVFYSVTRYGKRSAA